MTDESRAPFLEKAGYRRRRLIDAARLLPVFGAILFLVPLLWRQGDAGGVATTRAMLFVFGVWVVLVAVSALISARLRDSAELGRDAGNRTEPGGGG